MQLSTGKNVKFLSTFKSLYADSGIKAFYRGCSIASFRHVPYSGTRIIVYENLSKNSTLELYLGPGIKVFSGVTAGVIGQFIANPTDLIKVRMQSDSRMGRYTSPLNVFLEIMKERGIAGLWKGSIPSCVRAGLVNLGELVTYDSAKTQIMLLRLKYNSISNPNSIDIDDLILLKTRRDEVDDLLTHVSSSICSGFVAASISTPADVLKTRIMNSKSTNIKIFGLIQTILKEEGVRTLWRGFIPIWMRLAPWQLIFWVSYENSRKLLGLTGF
ncbi:hypothetical protein HK098_001565 [Nowakowskiella sp. JEL0407]|nr:hypothetical protein HK098_001565 [Nowakowskiella sp. JEL0407]